MLIIVHAFGVWRSLVSRLVRDQEAAGSSPATPTISSVLNQPESWMRTLDFFLPRPRASLPVFTPD